MAAGTPHQIQWIHIPLKIPFLYTNKSRINFVCIIFMKSSVVKWDKYCLQNCCVALVMQWPEREKQRRATKTRYSRCHKRRSILSMASCTSLLGYKLLVWFCKIFAAFVCSFSVAVFFFFFCLKFIINPRLVHKIIISIRLYIEFG